MSGAVNANLLLQGVVNSSPWSTPEEALAPWKWADQQQTNALNRQQTQQSIASSDLEMIARGAAYLDSLPDTAAKAAAYPGVVQMLQQAGFARNAPTAYPGDERISQLARMGTPSKELLEASTVQRALNPPNALNVAPRAPAAAPAGGGFTGDREQDRALIVKQESGGDPKALNYVARNDPTAYDRGATASGKYQFVNSTWREGLQLAGLDPASYARAMDAPEDVQDKVFDAVYAKYGSKPWQKGAQDWVRDENGQYRLATVGPPPGAQGGAPAGTPPATPAPYQTASLTPTPPPTGGAGTAPAPAATPAAQPAAQPVQPAQAPAIQPPAAPQPTNENGLTTAQQRTINAEKALAKTREQANAVLTKEQAYRDANITAASQYQQAQIAYQNELRSEQGETRAQAEELRKQEQAQRDREKAIRDAKFTGAPTGYQWENGQLIQSPGYQGAEKDERLDYRLDHGDPNTAQYAADYAAKKWQMSQQGNVIENDMSMYRPPAQPIQRPTYLPQPTPQSLDEVRKISNDASLNIQNINRFLKVLGETDGATIGAFFNNPASPQAQKLLGAFTGMKMSMRGPSAMNTGVLQPHEQTMLMEDLVSPQTVRGLLGTPEAAGARLGEIKLALLRKWDVEQRSVNNPGVIVRTEKEFNALPSGASFFDEDGNQRTKP